MGEVDVPLASVNNVYTRPPSSKSKFYIQFIINILSLKAIPRGMTILILTPCRRWKFDLQRQSPLMWHSQRKETARENMEGNHRVNSIHTSAFALCVKEVMYCGVCGRKAKNSIISAAAMDQSPKVITIKLYCISTRSFVIYSCFKFNVST